MEGFPVFDKDGNEIGTIPYAEGYLGFVAEGSYTCMFHTSEQCELIRKMQKAGRQ